MHKYINVRPVIVIDEPDAHQVWLDVGCQHFTVGEYCETKEDAEWLANQLRIALDALQAYRAGGGVVVAWRCDWPTWRQYHDETDPLPDKWDDEAPNITALYEHPSEEVRDAARVDWMEANLCRAGEVRDGSGNCIKLARVWSIMGELETLRETIDAAMKALPAMQIGDKSNET